MKETMPSTADAFKSSSTSATEVQVGVAQRSAVITPDATIPCTDVSRARKNNRSGSGSSSYKQFHAILHRSASVTTTASVTGCSSDRSYEEDDTDGHVRTISAAAAAAATNKATVSASSSSDPVALLNKKKTASDNEIQSTTECICSCVKSNNDTTPATTGTEHRSCVDCGGCAGCCECFAVTTTSSSPASSISSEDDHTANNQQQQQHAYSVFFKVGEVVPTTTTTTTLKQQRRYHRSSSSCTLMVGPGSSLVGASTKSHVAFSAGGDDSTSNRSYFVRRLALDDDDEEHTSRSSRNEQYYLKQHKDNTDNPHLAANNAYTMTGCAGKWTHCIDKIRIVTCRFLRWMTHYAATYPKSCVMIVIVTSVSFLMAGLLTNFVIETDNAYLWPPQEALSMDHTMWYYYESHFNYETAYFDMIIHANGKNVLSQDGVRRTFEAITAIRELEGYEEGCYWASMFGDEYSIGECKIHSVADFWNESLAIYDEQVTNDQDVRTALSAPIYPDGIIVDEARVLGKAERAAVYGTDDDTYTELTSAESFLIEFDLPWTNVTGDFELKCIERIQQLQNEWNQDPDVDFYIEISSYRSYSDEFFRSIIKDLPLLPAVFVIMAGFCCFVFWKPHRVHSRMLLGIGAVVCILLSIITGYGLLFMFGVAFTPVTTMMPFLMFGIGLDDAFILYGSYNRTDPRKDPVKRIEETIDDVGLSISITTLTSALAFFMGVFSNIPAVSWVCWYAFPTIVIDFIYQITFFISLVVLDERRIAANRRDICIWSIEPYEDDDEAEVPSTNTFDTTVLPQSPDSKSSIPSTLATPPQVSTDDESSVADKSNDTEVPSKQTKVPTKMQEKEHFADRFMKWFAKKILLKSVQVVVVASFLIIFGGMLYCATQLKQEFDYIDMVPKESYLRDYYTALDDYTIRNGLNVYVFFRDVDQSDPVIQEQMEAYLEDLYDANAIAHPPVYFWLRDFKGWVSDNNVTLGNLTFNEQIGEFFKDPSWEDLYGEHVALSKEDGHVVESRCIAYVDVDMRTTEAGTAMLENMRKVTARQPVNQDKDDWAFFTYADDYHILEFYNVVVDELIFTTITGIITVSIIAMIFIPHWTAVFFVFPFITFLYIDMLGFLYLSGVQINAISYITLVMSIGLMVDFIMHILLRYYEAKGTREQRVVETLSTMGASILVGAISTFLGVMLLVFSTSAMINNIFVAFIGLVTFGVLHGLIFLPTILAMIGPE